MNPSFRDEPLNPYESPIVATLVERPKVSKPARKRSPLLAVVFLILDAPWLAATAWLWSKILSSEWNEPIPSNVGPAGLWLALSIVFVISAMFWLVGFLCLKELLFYAIRR